MKTTKLLFMAIVIAALTASSALARSDGGRRHSSARSNTIARSSSHHWGNHHRNWRHHRHHRHHRPRVFVGFGFGYPYGYGYPYYRYPYGYGYYNQPRTVVYDSSVNGTVVVAVQRRLARAGYYRGAIDGVMGPGTRSAIRSYERTHGLRVDGIIDRRLLATMGLA